MGIAIVGDGALDLLLERYLERQSKQTPVSAFSIFKQRAKQVFLFAGGVALIGGAYLFLGSKAKDLDKTREYTIKYGDNLTKISRDHEVSVDYILQNNPGITNPHYIRAGDNLFIPKYGGNEK